MLIPIRTDVRLSRPPVANWVLIGLNVAIFLFTDVIGGPLGQEVKSRYVLDGARPLLFQYLTYQFLHGDILHLFFNMLFLWVFGNGVCDRMGSIPYTLFYIGGGVFAGIVFSAQADNPILGASGAIAAVTTAFLVLFPRVHITLVLFLFVVITPLQIPAMLVIVFKIILWDNVIAPAMDRGAASNVAYSAHLGGYLFGFLAAILMLALRGLPRNQFDLLGLWTRWGRRTGIAPLPAVPRARGVTLEELDSRPLEPLELTPLERTREQILERMSERDFAAAAALYPELLAHDPQQVLPRAQQLDLANYFAQVQNHPAAAQAYEAFLSAYPAAPDVDQVRLLLGLINSRYLGRPDRAATYLRDALSGLRMEAQRDMAQDELKIVEERLARGT